MTGFALPRPPRPPLVWPRLAALRAEFARRAVLARRPQPESVARPPRHLFLGELRSGFESWLAWRKIVPVAGASVDGAIPVMLLPGFGTHPVRMHRLRRGLSAAGHGVEDWGLGWNMGGTPEQLDLLCKRISDAAARLGRPVALVGWSLGGLYAREAAKRVPGAVALVVTMGTPFSGDLHANNAWRAYHWITGQDVAEPPVPGEYAVKPPVPTIALWSARDGIVSPRAARGRSGERDVAIALRCTHLGFASHPSVVGVLIEQLGGTRKSRA